MKRIALLLIGLALIGAILGCQSEAERKAELDKAQKAFDDAAAANDHEIDAKYFGTLIDMVGHDQGESVGMKLLLDCQQKGYQVHIGIEGKPDVGDASHANPPEQQGQTGMRRHHQIGEPHPEQAEGS